MQGSIVVINIFTILYLQLCTFVKPGIWYLISLHYRSRSILYLSLLGRSLEFLHVGLKNINVIASLPPVKWRSGVIGLPRNNCLSYTLPHVSFSAFFEKEIRFL